LPLCRFALFAIYIPTFLESRSFPFFFLSFSALTDQQQSTAENGLSPKPVFDEAKARG
jgi:hypothetical protein